MPKINNLHILVFVIIDASEVRMIRKYYKNFLAKMTLKIKQNALMRYVFAKCFYTVKVSKKDKKLNKRFKNMGAPDGLPLPPVRLVFLVTQQHKIETFYRNGIQGAACIRAVLQKNRFDINAFRSILDFGCGCGRIMRSWNELKGPKLYGVDYNADLLKWCRKYLPFAHYEVNELTSNLEFKDSSFDFIYAISVFTHLSEQLQFFWIRELKRILEPGGILLLTVHGATRLHQLSKEDQQRFVSGESIIMEEQFSGNNRCCAYHPEQYVRNHLAKDFRILDFLPGGAKDANQDVYLLQKVHEEPFTIFEEQKMLAVQHSSFRKTDIR